LTDSAKGRIERQFLTAQDRLVKGLRVSQVSTLDQANAYLENEYLAWWNQTLVVKAADPADAHRPLDQEHELVAILSHVEQRQVTNDYTVRYQGKVYQIDRRDIQVGMRKGWVRVEQRLDGSIAVQFQGRYVRVRRCAPPLAPPKTPAPPTGSTAKIRRKSDWMKNFSIRSKPSLSRATEVTDARS